jgi:uncharacterized membrane protein HdeD (DUF308 family)
MSEPRAEPGESGSLATPPALLRWVLAVRAVVVIGLGITFLATGTMRPVLGNLVAIYWLIGGVLTLRWVRARGRTGADWHSALAGVVGVILSVLVLSRSLYQGRLSVNAGLAIFGACAIITGALRLSGGFHDGLDPARQPRIRMIALGVIEVIVGVVFVAADHTTRQVAVVAGLWALVGGPIMFADALTLHRTASRRSANRRSRSDSPR